MGRRTSGQVVGLEKIGNVQANSTTLTTTQANTDLILDPNGVGGVVINGDVTILNQGDLRLRESDGNGTNYIAMQAAANMAANYTLTWPAAVTGTNGFFLTSDTSGNLSWASAASGIPVSDPGSTATVHYPLFGTNGGAVPSTLSPLARSNLSFVPSTGELTATAGSFGNIYGGTGASGQLTIRGTTSGTKSTASILMTDGVTSSSTATGTLVVTGGVGVSGQVTCGTLSAGTITETSSITLKENVKPIENALDSILKLAGVIYDRKDGSAYNEAGLIAEDVNRILPDLVTKDDFGNPLGIKYTKLTAYLIESIKEIKKEISSLKG